MGEKKFGIMTNDDPEATIKTLCFMSNDITREKYKKCYEKNFNDNKKISEQHNDAHFYLLTQFKLLENVTNNKYKKSLCVNYFCNNIDKNNKSKWKKSLKVLIMNSKKKEMFIDFLKFLKTPKKIEDIKSRYSAESYRTLKSWCDFADLIHADKNYCYAVLGEKKYVYNLKEFWRILVQTYKNLQRTDVLAPRRTYIPIEDIRRIVSCELGILDPKEFNDNLTTILDIDKYRSLLRLHGAPTHAYDEMEPFDYKRKSYLLLSMTDV